MTLATRPPWGTTGPPQAPDPALTSVLPVAIYARLSENPDGTSDSCETQIAIGIRTAEERWPGRPYLIFSDDDITAADDTVYRPDYERMLNAIRRGQVGDVLARNQGRISRHETIWPAFKVVCLRAGISVLRTMQGGDISLAEGQSLPGDIMNLINAEYAKQIKLNINDTLDERARQGRPSGGRAWCYRHERDGNGVSHLVVLPDRKAIAHTMASMMLSGLSYADVSRWLAAEGIPAPRAGEMRKGRDGVKRPASDQWTSGAIKSVLLGPTHAGLRQHRGTGNIVGPGNWEPIFDEATYTALRRKLESPRAITRSDGRTHIRKVGKRPTRKYLASRGICWCHRCGTDLGGGPVGGVSYYLCQSKYGGCDGLGIAAEQSELVIVEGLFAYLDSPEFDAYLAASDVDHDARLALERERDAIDERERLVGQAVILGTMTQVAAEGAVEAARAERARIGAELAALTPAPIYRDPDVLRTGWDGLTLGQRRAVLFSLGCRVEVLPAWGPRVFNRDRLVVRFGPAAAAREAAWAASASAAARTPRRKMSAT